MCAVAENACIKLPSLDAELPFDFETLHEASQMLSGLELSDLQGLLALATHRSIKARRIVCRKDDPGYELFIVLSGKLKVCTASDDGKEAILGLIETGEVFGEMALRDGQVRSATVVAVQDSVLLALHRKALPLLRRISSRYQKPRSYNFERVFVFI